MFAVRETFGSSASPSRQPVGLVGFDLIATGLIGNAVTNWHRRKRARDSEGS